SATSSVINAFSVKTQEVNKLASTLQLRIGTMKPCFLKLSHRYSCVRHERQFMGFEAQVESAERRLKPF
ncbi:MULTISPECIES: hypothetical protein, partial [unclassified Sporosarcina]|uniref:hypothetical protein n=1 Tax=unclassified Sporosarcina TaxID=2647733 RepID=UPI00203F7DBE